MSLFCSISGTQPLHPVVAKTSGHVYEKALLLKALADNDGKDPITGDSLTEDDIVELKTAPSQPTAPPRAPTFTSVPSLLHTLQQEWDATMLECLELRRQGAELRQELSHALYKEDAAMRVLARVTRERDESRDALASVKATLGPAFSTGNGAAEGGDASMEGVEKQEVQVSAVPADVKSRIEETQAALSAGRKKRKPTAETATPEDVKTFTQTATVPSLHTTKPPGVSAVALAKDGEILVTGGLDKDLIVFSRATGKNIAKLKGHAKKVTAVLSSTSLTSDDVPSFLVSSSVDKTVRVWTPNGSKQVYGASSTISLDGEATGLALHPSNTLAAASSSDGTWSLMDLNGDKASVVLSGGLPEGVTTALTSVAFHPDGALFALGSSEGKIYIFDILAGGKCAITLSSESATGAVTSISFSENGYILASSTSGSQAVSIWDLRKGVSTHTIALEGADESATVSTVAFDYSNQFLAVVGSDARIYQFKTWELLAKSDENAAELTGVAWGKDSREVVVVGLDRTARVLAAPSSDE